jgi:beta-galactosidase
MNVFSKNGFQISGAVLMTLTIAGLASCASVPAKSTGTTLREQTRLDADWRFQLGDLSPTNTIAAGFDDQQWQRVQVPHDYVLEGSYSRTNDEKHGYLPLQVAWYRKHFFIPQVDAGKVLHLEFGGIYRDSQVWLNGRFLGRHPSGYTGFYYDITKAARCGAENIIAVRVDPRGFEGHWYEGGGIYRHVYLTALAPLHVAPWGTYVISRVPGGDEGASAEAELTLQTTVQNDGAVPAQCGVVSEISGPDGVVLAVKDTVSVGAGSQQEVTQHGLLRHPRLWSLQTPQLYQLHTTILQDGRPVDSTQTPFGIRTIRFDPDKGFFLNGQHVEIQGAANHQDFAGVGIAMPDSLQPWRVRRLKEMGCNGWRTAHNPPDTTVLDACDQLGMLVMEENRHLGDSYLGHSPPGTTCTNFSDLDFMIQRDRNHPSVIMWSLCNEEGLRGKPAGVRMFAAMAQEVRRFDNTRPITCAINGSWLTNGINDEDIIGVNYHARDYDGIHQANPRRPMFGSEAANNKMTRGQYVGDRAHGWVSCYNLSDKGWVPVITRPFIAGSYTWTGFDYKGEPNPYGWPDVSNNTGLMDSCGFPKDKYYYFEACWSDRPMVHLMPDRWNWLGQEGQAIRVIAFSNARQVELFLNGRSLGIKTMPPNEHLEWEVSYQPGRLSAKGYTNGKVVAAETLETTGVPARILLSSDRKALQADGEDAEVVAVSIVDGRGRVVRTADNHVSFQLTGRGRILGVGNGNPSDHDPDKAHERNAFNGHCMAIIQAGAAPEVLRLTATSPGLKPASLTFRSR